LTRFHLQVYVSYLVFQLVSHKSLYDDKNGQKPETVKYAPRTGPSAKEKTKKFFRLSTIKESTESEPDSAATEDPRPVTDEERPGPTEPEEVDGEIPELSLPVTIVLLVVVTAFVAVTAEWLVDSIDGLASGGGISKEFIGLILLPIVGNAAEHVTAVTVSVKDKLTLSLGVAVGSSIVSSLSSPTGTSSTYSPTANRFVCHPIHRHPRVDDRSPTHDALRPVRVDRALLLCVDC
jgi:Ca2+:H+ antiporter